MKKIFLCASLAITQLLTTSCNNNSKAETGTHTHDDGSTHADHDTAKPVQQEFSVTDSTHKDSTSGKHTHEDGSEHSH